MSAHFNVAELKQQRAGKVYTAKEILDKAEQRPEGQRGANADELLTLDRLEDEVRQIDASIAQAEAHLRRRQQNNTLLAEIENAGGALTGREPPANGAANGGGPMLRVPASARRCGSLRAFAPKAGEDYAAAELKAYRAGQWIRATMFGSPVAQDWCGRNGMPIDIRAAMSSGSAADGGYLVPDEFSSVIIDLREKYSVYRQNVRVQPMGRDTMFIPRKLVSVVIAPVAEAGSIGLTSPTFDQVQLTAKKAGGVCLISTEVAEDAIISLAEWLAMDFAWAFAQFEDRIGFTGVGSAGDLLVTGLTELLKESAALKGGVAATATHNTFALVDATDLAKLMGTLPEYAAPNAKFYCSRTAAELVFGRLQATAGGNTIGDLSGSQVGRSYLGYPIVVSQVMPSAQTALTDGSVMILFGDLSLSSTMGDRREVRIMPSEHRYFDTDQIGIRGTERIDIKNHDVGTATVAGPMVALLANLA